MINRCHTHACITYYISVTCMHLPCVRASKTQCVFMDNHALYICKSRSDGGSSASLYIGKNRNSRSVHSDIDQRRVDEVGPMINV